MSRIESSSIVSGEITRRITPLPQAQDAGSHALRARQVGRAQKAAKRMNMNAVDKEIYRQSLSAQSEYMRGKRITILSKERAEVRENIFKILQDGVYYAHRAIKNSANSLADYKKFRTLKLDIGEMARRKSKAKAAALKHAPLQEFTKMPRDTQRQVKHWADVLSLSYKGANVPPSNLQLPDGYELLADEEMPQSLAMFYDDTSGLIQTPSGCKALLMKSGDKLAVVFAGTEGEKKSDIGRGGTMQADFVQRVGGFSSMYRDASGITRLLLEHNPDKKMDLVGHSLGGGQAQYALATNADEDSHRMRGWTFNSAGLSASTLGAIESSRVEKVQDLVINTRVDGDPVSPGSRMGERFKGVLLGRTWTLKRAGARPIDAQAHRVLTLRGELDKAVKE